MKVCTRCNAKKQEQDFQARKASKDGLTASCKTCLQYYDKSRANKPHRVAARLAYSKTKNGIITGNRAKYKWEKRNSIKKGAAQIVNNAVRDGKIEKETICQECGIDGVIHGHHDDYAFPLVVRWLCPLCHCKWHKENGGGLNG